MTYPSSHVQPFLIISDSHGKCLNSVNITTTYRIENYSFSGLQWIHNYDLNLSILSLIQNEPFASLLRSTSYVLFLVGTNSIRNPFVIEIIDQIDQIFTFIYCQYPHLQTIKSLLLRVFLVSKFRNNFLLQPH